MVSRSAPSVYHSSDCRYRLQGEQWRREGIPRLRHREEHQQQQEEVQEEEKQLVAGRRRRGRDGALPPGPVAERGVAAGDTD